MENYFNQDFVTKTNELLKNGTTKRERLVRETKQEFCYSIDWLTLNIKLRDINNPYIKNDKIYCEEREKGTAIFKRIRDYYNERDELIFTIVFLPHSSILAQDFAQLQIANKWLYVGNLLKLVQTIFFQANFELVNISRIDLCTDFFTFKNDLQAQNFIQDVANGNNTKINPSKINFWGKTEEYNINYHAMNIGDKESTFNFKLYNKTKELEEKHEKGYIKHKWRMKLQSYEEMEKMPDKSMDVWRLEVSIKDWNKIKIDGKKVIEINNNVYDIIQLFPYFMQFFISKKFVWKDIEGKFIDFIDNPHKELSGKYLCTNIPNTDEINTTNKQKKQILKATISIIEQSITFEKANEYLLKLEELIQEEDYYTMLHQLGLNYNTISSYISYKFQDKQFNN